MKQLFVIADSREPGKTIEYLSKLKVSTIIEKLDTGDFYLPSTMEDGISFLVERKTATDFARSLKDKSIWNQIKSMKSSNAEPILIVEGSLSKIEKFTEWPSTSIISSLLSIKYIYNIDVFFTPSPRWTALTLYSLARIAQIRKEKKPRRLIVKKKPRSMEEQVLFVVESLPSIGPKQAVELLDSFKTLKNLVNASEKELKKVSKIGKKKSKLLYDLFNFKFKL